MALLHRKRRLHGALGIREAERKLVSAAVDLLSGVRLRGVPDDLPVLGERGGVAVAELLHEPRGALDVREQERDAHDFECTPLFYA